MTSPSVIVHGGAGDLAPERAAGHVAGCERAVTAALEVLRAGGNALDAAQRAVELMEDDPRYNAGRGSALNRDGAVELDAAMMEGAGLRVGSVCASPPYRHPVAVARAVLEARGHVVFAGPGVARFAESVGFEGVPAESLVTEAARRRWEAVRDGVAEAGWSGGTVGAVVFDGVSVAAATSTGGVVNKLPGRVGDSPIPGAGTWADDEAGGVSATGHGEPILRLGVGFRVVELMRAGVDPDEAARRVIDLLAARVQGRAGLVCLDRFGRPGRAWNTRTMSWAWGDREGARGSGA